MNGSEHQLTPSPAPSEPTPTAWTLWGQPFRHQLADDRQRVGETDDHRAARDVVRIGREKRQLLERRTVNGRCPFRTRRGCDRCTNPAESAGARANGCRSGSQGNGTRAATYFVRNGGHLVFGSDTRSSVTAVDRVEAVIVKGRAVQRASLAADRS